MKMPEKMMEHLCQRVLEHLKTKQLVKCKVPEPQVLARMVAAMKQDLAKDAALDAEVRKMLEQYRDKIDRGEIDEQKMYQMIRKQIIKERKLVI